MERLLSVDYCQIEIDDPIDAPGVVDNNCSAALGWDVTENANLYVGVNNAFDEDAPIILSGVPGNITGTDTAADVYDPIGRAWYVGFKLRN